MNEWLKRKAEKKEMLVRFWVLSDRGERVYYPEIYPFKEVITHHCSEKTTLDGFSVILDGKEIFCSFLSKTLYSEEKLRITMPLFPSCLS